jgi:type IV pilus assembly protein PilW
MSIKFINKHQQGFSLVELMVAIVIGLIILAGVSSVMVSNKKTYTAQDSLARLQENARAVMLILTHDMRNIGYWGCNPDKDNVTNALKSASSIDPSFWSSNVMEGAEGSDGLGAVLYPSGTNMVLTPAPLSNTDILMVRGVDTGDSLGVQQPMVNESAAMQLEVNHGLKAGEVVVVSDCDSADIFQVTNANQSTGTIVHQTGSGSPGNRLLGGGNKLSKSYGPDAQVMRYKAIAYYIGAGASGEPSLWRQTLALKSSSSYEPATQELVEGIENLQVLYGVDTNNDRLPDDYRTANLVGASTWNNVVAIRFGIIARALANLETTKKRTANAATSSQMDTRALDIDGDGVNDFLGTETSDTTYADGTTVKDRQYQRRMFRTTVLLRNMQIGK